MCHNKHYDVYFNHESGEKHATDKFAKLIEIYSEQVRLLKQKIQTSPKIAFVLHVDKPSPEKNSDVVRLWQYITDTYGAHGKMLICFNTWRYGTDATAYDTTPTPARAVKFIDLNYPFADYVWHNPQHTFSAAGAQFERTLIEYIKDYLEDFQSAVAA
jgi:hypothetical protein